MKCWKIKSQLLCPLIISTFEEEEDFGKINSLHPAQKRPIAKSRELQFLRIWNFKGHHRISHKKIIKLQITSGLISQKYDDGIPWFFDRTWIVSLSDDRKKSKKINTENNFQWATWEEPHFKMLRRASSPNLRSNY